MTLLSFLPTEALKRPRSMMLLQFFKFRHLKTGLEHKTIGIFAILHSQNMQKPRYCCLFWNGGRILAAQKWPGARDCWHFRHFAWSKHAEATILPTFFEWQLEKYM